jgi:type IV pilus assembly protein PilW
MNETRMRSFPRPRSGQRGYSLIEMMVAIAVAVFLLAGLFSVLQNTRNTSNNQTALAQLQDNERIAMTIITETVQQAGYYPNPLNTTLAAGFPASTVTTAFSQAGQLLLGGFNTTDVGGVGDFITVRYQSDASNTILNCLGKSDTTGVAHEYRFSVAKVGKVTSLFCTRDADVAIPLVSNVSNLRVFYGVDTTGLGNGVNAYIPGELMTATNWLNVYSVKITLTFANPLAGQPGQATAPAIAFTRLIGVMSKV